MEPKYSRISPADAESYIPIGPTYSEILPHQDAFSNAVHNKRGVFQTGIGMLYDPSNRQRGLCLFAVSSIVLSPSEREGLLAQLPENFPPDIPLAFEYRPGIVIAGSESLVSAQDVPPGVYARHLRLKATIQT